MTRAPVNPVVPSTIELLPLLAIVAIFPLTLLIHQPRFLVVRRTLCAIGAVAFTGFAITDPASRNVSLLFAVLAGGMFAQSFWRGQTGSPADK